MRASAGGRALGAMHPRQGRIIDAISKVLMDERGPLQAREVHARVEGILGHPVRWSSVKATLAANVTGPAPRFVRVARGRYGAPSPCSARCLDQPARKLAWYGPRSGEKQRTQR